MSNDFTDEDEEVIDQMRSALQLTNVFHRAVVAGFDDALARLLSSHEEAIAEISTLSQQMAEMVSPSTVDALAETSAREAITEAWTAMHPHDPALEWTRTTEEPWATIARALS